MNQQKVGQYFFIIASVIAILDGALTLDATMQSIKYIVLIVAGAIIGLLRHENQKEFIIAGLAVVITGYVITGFFDTYGVLGAFSLILFNIIVFLSSAIVVVGIEQIANIITAPELKTQKKEEEHIKELHQMELAEIELMTFERIWGYVILVGVALTFIVLLSETFFDVSSVLGFIYTLDIIITVLFIVDLFILFEKSKGWADFFKNNIFDIIAAVPAVGVFRAIKIVRAVRIVKTMKGTLHLTKLIRFYKSAKFFSEKSYFNHVEQEVLKNQGMKKTNAQLKTKPLVKAKTTKTTVRSKK